MWATCSSTSSRPTRCRFRDKGFPHYALHVPTDRFDTTIEALRAAGVSFLGQPSSRVDFGTTVLAAFVHDPAGNFIELTNVGPR